MTTDIAHSSYTPCFSRSCHEFSTNFYIICFLGFIAYLIIKKFLQEPVEPKIKSKNTHNSEATKTHSNASPEIPHKTQQEKVGNPSDLSHKKAGIMSAIADGKLSYDQACSIEKHQNLYNFNSEEILEIKKITGSVKISQNK